jgi:hypothetical protein
MKSSLICTFQGQWNGLQTYDLWGKQEACKMFWSDNRKERERFWDVNKKAIITLILSNSLLQDWFYSGSVLSPMADQCEHDV